MRRSFKPSDFKKLDTFKQMAADTSRIRINGMLVDTAAPSDLASIAKVHQIVSLKITGPIPTKKIKSRRDLNLELLNMLGATIENVPKNFSLLTDQTDKEKIPNPNIFDPQLKNLKSEQISPLTQYGESDPFYEHDEQISKYLAPSAPTSFRILKAQGLDELLSSLSIETHAPSTKYTF